MIIIIILYSPTGIKSKNQRKQQKKQLPGLCQTTGKAMEHEGEGDTTCIRCTRKISKHLMKQLEELEIEGQAEAIQTTALLRSTSIMRRVQEIKEDLLSLKI